MCIMWNKPTPPSGFSRSLDYWTYDITVLENPLGGVDLFDMIHIGPNVCCNAPKLRPSFKIAAFHLFIHHFVFTMHRIKIFIVIIKRIKGIAWIPSHHLHLQWKFKLWAENFSWGNKAKHCWVMSWQRPAIFLSLHLKHTLLPRP